MTRERLDVEGRATIAAGKRVWRRWSVPLGGLTAVVLAVAACGGGSSSGPGVAAGSTTTAVHASPGTSPPVSGLLAYAACMRSHGLPDFPDPDASGGISKPAVIRAFRSVSEARGQAAQDACSRLLPSGGLGGQANQTITAQQQRDYLRAAACMRSHGITNFPDPTFSDGHVSFPVPSGVDSGSPQFTQARQVCQKLIPAGLPYSGRSG